MIYKIIMGHGMAVNIMKGEDQSTLMIFLLSSLFHPK